MKPRAFFISLLLIALGAIGAVACLNLYMDTYGVLRADFDMQFTEPNRNFVSIEHLLAHSDDYDSLLFGSSVVNYIDVRHMPEGRWYNMTTAEGVPAEFLEDLRLLIGSGMKLSRVQVGLDDFSYQIDPVHHRSQLLNRQHYLIIGQWAPRYFLDYYLRMPTKNEIKEYRKKRAERTWRFDITVGQSRTDGADEAVERDPATHRADPVFLKPRHYRGDRMDAALEEIRQIIELCRANHIEVRFFINPIHHTTYADTDKAMLDEFKGRLSRITPYIDFSGPNWISDDNFYWWETSHFRPVVGDMIINSLSGIGGGMPGARAVGKPD